MFEDIFVPILIGLAAGLVAVAGAAGLYSAARAVCLLLAAGGKKRRELEPANRTHQKPLLQQQQQQQQQRRTSSLVEVVRSPQDQAIDFLIERIAFR